MLRRAVPAVDFLIDELRRRTDNSIPSRARELEEVAPLLALLPAVERDLYVERLGLELKLDVRLVRQAVKGGGAVKLPARAATRARRRGRPAAGRRAGPAGHPARASAPLSARGGRRGCHLLTNGGLRDTYRAAMQMQQATGRVEHAKVLQATAESVRDAVAKVALSGQFASDGDPTRALDDCLSALQRAKLQCDLQEVRDQMTRARAARDEEALRGLVVRKVELERKIHETR